MAILIDLYIRPISFLPAHFLSHRPDSSKMLVYTMKSRAIVINAPCTIIRYNLVRRPRGAKRKHEPRSS